MRKRQRKRGLHQYRTIFRISSSWAIATLALAGTVFHFFEIQDACADILGVDGPVDAQVAMRPPGVVVVCQTNTAPARSAEIPMATPALVILWTALGVLAATAFLFGYATSASRSTAERSTCSRTLFPVQRHRHAQPSTPDPPLSEVDRKSGLYVLRHDLQNPVGIVGAERGLDVTAEIEHDQGVLA